jgi:hypothetical protein
LLVYETLNLVVAKQRTDRRADQPYPGKIGQFNKGLNGV